ncbi:unnamed protein product [Camellia sinensis]
MEMQERLSGISEIEKNTSMFSFEDRSDWIEVLLNAPWTVEGGLLILSPWGSGKVLPEFHFSCSPFWVQVHGLPIDYLTKENGVKIGRDLGTLIRVDKNVFDGRLVWRKFMRIQVIVDIRNPLKTGFHLRRSESPDIWVDFKYEKLSQFCYNCGRIGHVYRGCKFSTSSVLPVLGQKPRVFSRSREVCADLVAFPLYKAIVKQSMVEVVWPKMESRCRQNSDAGVNWRYLFWKLIINGLDSIAMAVKSAFFCLHVSYANAYEGKWKLHMVIVCYLCYLVLKLTLEVWSSCYFRGCDVRVPDSL